MVRKGRGRGFARDKSTDDMDDGFVIGGGASDVGGVHAIRTSRSSRACLSPPTNAADSWDIRKVILSHGWWGRWEEGGREEEEEEGGRGKGREGERDERGRARGREEGEREGGRERGMEGERARIATRSPSYPPTDHSSSLTTLSP